jgi:hypothetical protein
MEELPKSEQAQGKTSSKAGQVITPTRRQCQVNTISVQANNWVKPAQRSPSLSMPLHLRENMGMALA